MLNALALGARELAGLPVTPPTTTNQSRVAFPSKVLPGPLHRRYLAAEQTSESEMTRRISSIADGISNLALQRGKARAEELVPDIIREKQLRIRKKGPSITPLDSASTASPAPTSSATSYTQVAAEYFIAPLIEKFWGYLRDEQTRETRSRFVGKNGYRGAGTAMILDGLMLRHLLTSLSVLVHAARHSVAFLRVIAPDALQLAITMGSKPVSTVAVPVDEEDEGGGTKGEAEKEKSVLAATLELALVVLDTSFELDGGRELALEQAMLLAGTQDWATQIFTLLDDQGGVATNVGSGEALNRVRRASAGVLLRIEEILDRWRRSMISQ